jgi:hypothetical protein
MHIFNYYQHGDHVYFFCKIKISSWHWPNNSSPKPVKLTSTGVHPALSSVNTKDCCEVRQPGREVVHLPSSIAQVMNERSYTSTLPYVFMACTGTSVHSCHVSVCTGTSVHSCHVSVCTGTSVHSCHLSVCTGTSVHSCHLSVCTGTSVHSCHLSVCSGCF